MKRLAIVFSLLMLVLVAGQSLAQLPIIDNVPDLNRPEDDPDFYMRVELNQANNTGERIIVSYTITPGTASYPADYSAPPSSVLTVPIPLNATSRGLAPVMTIDDNIYEGNETFTVAILSARTEITNQPIAITDNSATGTITDNDPLPTVAIYNDGEDEGDSPENDVPDPNRGRFRVELSNPASQNVWVDYFTADGTATVADNDYVDANARLTIPAGETLRRIRIDYVADNKVEDDEQFFVNISSAMLANETPLTVTDPRARGRILNDDFSADIDVTAKWVREADGGPMLTTVMAGEVYRFVLQMFNRGDADAKNVVIEDVLPSGLVFQYADNGGSFDGSKVTWNVHSILRNQEKRVRVYAMIDPDLPEGTEITNMGCKVDGDIPDPDDGNNCADVTVLVLQPDVDQVANLNTNINVGQAPLLVKFESMKPLTTYKWMLDLDKRSLWDMPSYIYRHVVPPAGPGKNYEISLDGPVESEEFADMLRVYGPGGFGHLRLVSGSPTTSAGSWANAVDGDLYWYDGTAEAAADESGAAWAVFEFTDQSTRKVNQVRLMTDTGIDNLKKQATDFKVLVSTDGVAFSEVLAAQKTNNVNTPGLLHDDWMSWTFAPVNARFIKLMVTAPLSYTYAAIGEFEVWFDTRLADPDKSTLSVSAETVTMTVKDAENNPITGLTAHDIVVYSFNTAGYYGNPNVALGTGLVEDSANPGTYTCSVTNKGLVEASVNGVIIPKPVVAMAAAAEAAAPVAERAKDELAPAQALPAAYALEQNYPNPFNPETTIRYQLPDGVQVSLKVYDVNGRVVETLVNQFLSAGHYTATWRTQNYASGVYFYHLVAGSFKAIKSMTLLR
jgi:uncharacterized repeat protein (TIGR01451 family)